MELIPIKDFPAFKLYAGLHTVIFDFILLEISSDMRTKAGTSGVDSAFHINIRAG